MAKSIVLIISVIVTFSSAALAAEPINQAAVDWQLWQNLPVQNGGRIKPLDTLAWERLYLTSSRASIIDSQTGQRLNPTAAYLTLLFEWNGWDHERREMLLLSQDWPSQYFYLHAADRWDKTSLLRIDYPELKPMIGLPDQVKYVAPAILATASIIDPRTQQSMLFPVWGRKLSDLKDADKSLTQLEEKAFELWRRLETYETERMGMDFELLPRIEFDSARWMTAGELLLTKFNDSSDPKGYYRNAQSALQQARAAFRSGDAQSFNKRSEEFRGVLRTALGTTSSYVSEFKLDLEVAYNHWEPFHYAWMLMLLATVIMLLHLGSHWRMLYGAAIGAYACGLVVLFAGFAMRVVIAGRPPVTNMYESVIYVGSGVAIFGIVFEAIYRKKYIITAAAAVSTIALLVADHCPAILDSSVRPLEPVLRSNYWLVTHVMTIALSYAAFALALGIANITLGYYLFRSNKVDTIRALSLFTYKVIQVGVVLLAAGIILGGVWADYSWGRFWGWDPKEVWALVALLGYLAVLHARYGGAVGHRGLAALSVVCFSLVIMAWYGVNFVLGAGLHSYGFGGGGQGIVYSAIALQWFYAAVAIRRSRPDPSSPASPLAVHQPSYVA
jgi:cytochrome c-type biogenesis protein CcsB